MAFSQSSFIFFVLMAAFLIFITMRGELGGTPGYLDVLGL